jgi:glycosyltransferase involved in cell wall biosynthesis
MPASLEGLENMLAKNVLILIPAWNEAERIGNVLHQIPEDYSVLVVDDGSSDPTAEVAYAHGAQVLSHGSNLGKGVALMNGFKWALEREFAAVITLDADGQHNPAEIRLFQSALIETGADLIIGRRSPREMPFPRNLANAFGSWLLSRILATEIYDNQSGYRLYSRVILEQLEMRRKGFEFEVDVILQALEGGYELRWVDIETIYLDSITSHFRPLADTMKFFSVVWLAFQTRRNMKMGR